MVYFHGVFACEVGAQLPKSKMQSCCFTKESSGRMRVMAIPSFPHSTPLFGFVLAFLLENTFLQLEWVPQSLHRLLSGSKRKPCFMYHIRKHLLYNKQATTGQHLLDMSLNLYFSLNFRCICVAVWVWPPHVDVKGRIVGIGSPLPRCGIYQ